MYSVFPNGSFIITKKIMVTPNFSFGYQEHLLIKSSAFFWHSFKTRENIPVFIDTTHRKTDYLKMCRTYAQQQK